MNIVQTVLNLLSTGSATHKIASDLGIDHAQAQKGIGASVPALLAGLLGSASKPGGAATLADTLGKYEPGVFDNPASLLDKGEYASKGKQSLDTLMGGSITGKLVGALSRFTGLSEGITSKLFGLVTPIILTTLAKYTKGLNASGILDMLKGQKENISNAMPPGLERTLASSVPGFDEILSGEGEKSYAEHYGSDGKVKHADRTPVGAGHSGGDWSAMKWLLPLLAICAALFFLPKMVRSPGERPAVVGEYRGDNATAHRGEAVIHSGTALLRQTHSQIASITDETSAAAALPKLKDDTAKLSSLRDVLAKLPEPTRKAALDQFREPVEKIREAAAPVLALPGVGETVKPTLDALLSESDELMDTK